MTCGIALNIDSIVCSCVSTQKGTILKAIVADFLNLLNRKSYRHSLVFFVGPCIPLDGNREICQMVYMFVCLCVCVHACAHTCTWFIHCLVVYGKGSVITSVVVGPCMDMRQASFAIQLNTQTQEMQIQLYRLSAGSVKNYMVVK